MLDTAAVLAGAAWPRTSGANVRRPYNFDLQPPTTGREAFIKWAIEHRGENPKILAARWTATRSCGQQRFRQRPQRPRLPAHAAGRVRSQAAYRAPMSATFTISDSA
jgi:hypothetical protein